MPNASAITPETITEDDWIERYKPLVNPIDASFGYDYGDGCTLVETYGEHIAYLDTIEPERVWTVLDGDEGQVIVSGRHHVNRIGYIVTAEPHSGDIEVAIDD